MKSGSDLICSDLSYACTLSFRSTLPCQLMESGLIERHELYTPQLLTDYLLRVNKMLSHRDADQWADMVGDEEGQFVRDDSVVSPAVLRSTRPAFFGHTVTMRLIRCPFARGAPSGLIAVAPIILFFPWS